MVQLANGSHLSDDFWGNAASLLERLGQRLDLTPVQTMLFVVLIELSDDRKIVLKQLAEFLGCRKVELLNYTADFEELIRRQLIRRRRSGSAEPDTYRVPKMVLEALQAGKKFTQPPICGLTIDQFFVRLGKLISYTSQQEMSQTELAEELQQLIGRVATINRSKSAVGILPPVSGNCTVTPYLGYACLCTMLQSLCKQPGRPYRLA